MPTHATITRGTARLACTVDGAGPSVFLLHDGLTDSRGWGPVRARIGAGFRTVAFDRRGHGDTVATPEPHDPLADALAVLDAAGVDRTVVVGASRGGQLAIDLALLFPERVAGLVLIGAGVGGAPEPDPAAADPALQLLAKAWLEAMASGDPEEINRLSAHVWLDGASAPEGRVQGWARQEFLAMNGRRLGLADQIGTETGGVPDAWDRAATLAVPTLLLVGSYDDIAVPATNHLAATIPRARLEMLDGTGHLPHVEGHRDCLDLIADYLGA
jgi:pimeloyl-ACP methyl ester carboxylesterase